MDSPAPRPLEETIFLLLWVCFEVSGFQTPQRTVCCALSSSRALAPELHSGTRELGVCGVWGRERGARTAVCRLNCAATPSPSNTAAVPSPASVDTRPSNSVSLRTCNTISSNPTAISVS